MEGNKRHRGKRSRSDSTGYGDQAMEGMKKEENEGLEPGAWVAGDVHGDGRGTKEGVGRNEVSSI